MQEQSEVTQLTGMALDQAVVRVKHEGVTRTYEAENARCRVSHHIGNCVHQTIAYGDTETEAWANAADKVIEAEYSIGEEMTIEGTRWHWMRRSPLLLRNGFESCALALESAKRDYIARSRRLEPKPDAEAIFCPDPDCVYPAGHESDHSPSAQPKPDAADEHSQLPQYGPISEELAADGRAREEDRGKGFGALMYCLLTRREEQLMSALSAPRNSALEEAAKETIQRWKSAQSFAETKATTLGGWWQGNGDGIADCARELENLIARFRALGGE